MNLLGKVFNWMLIIGIALLVGRIITMVFRYLDISFITFFKDYSIISIIILLIGLIGTEVMKVNKKRSV
jgi:hypothetical protein